jgi:hypothetical protein
MFYKRLLIAGIAYLLTVSAAPAADCKDPANKKLVECLEARLEILEAELNSVKGQIPNLNNIVIEWIDHDGNCMGIMGGNTNVQIFGTCVDPNRNRFRVRGFRP